MWAKRAGGESSDIANDVASFADGSSIVGGRFEGTATFGGVEAGETHLTSAGGTDIFVARYGANGTLTWAKRAGGLEGDQVWGVATFDDGTCVATGSFPDVATFGPGEANQTPLTNPGDGQTAFVARYDSNGTLAWAERAGGETTTIGRGIGGMADDTCVVTGRFDGTATFGPGEAGETILTSANVSDAFIAHYAVSGELRWATSAGGPNSDAGDAIVSLTDGHLP